MGDRLHWAASAAAAALCALLPAVGGAPIALAGLIAGWAAVSAERRVPLLRIAAGLLWGAAAGLAFALLADRFELRYVWLYSGAALPAHLKLANLWGGDEGTTLLLAALCATFSVPVARELSARIDAGALIAACYALAAAWLAPFAATPAEWLAQAPSQGMNAHLMKVWMLLHAPAVLAAYAWTLSLAAPALAALGGGAPRWPASATAHARRAWALLTAGIGFGMVWAFEDAMYGQVWHWDPVQTAVLAVWCLLGAHLHGIPGWGIGRGMWRWMPAAALLAAALTAVAMGVTRNELLASSHRYVGASSWAVHFALAGLLAAAGVGLWARGRRPLAGYPPVPSQPAAWGLRATQVAFALAGLAAAGHLAWAFAAGMQGAARPDELKPFLATLAAWAQGSELPALRAAFDRWDVDGYALARALLVPLTAVGLVGGWFFARRVSRRIGRVSLAFAASSCLAVFLEGGPLARHYSGAGVLSQQVVAVLPHIDASLLTGAYLALGCTAWAATAAWRTPRAARRVLPLWLVHLGAMLALWGALLSTGLNAYSQHLIEHAGDWQRAHRGYAFRIASLQVDRAPDGGRGGSEGSFRALAQVEIETPSQGVVRGQTLYRDARAPVAGGGGPVRQLCEVLDYRFARYADRPGYLLHPFVAHGWLRDVQLWVSTSAAVAALEGGAAAGPAVVVLRSFPFASLLWAGLVLTTAGALSFALRPAAARRA